MKHVVATVVLTVIVTLLFGCSSVSGEWWNTSWHYAFNVSVNATVYDRVDVPVEIDVNLTRIMQDKGSGTFDENSLRVIESITPGGTNERESFFYKYSNFNPSTNAVGLVVFIINGTTKNNTVRNFTVYFDIIENGPKDSVSYNFSNGKGLGGRYSNTTQRIDEVLNLTYALDFGAFLEVTWKGWVNTTEGNFTFTVEHTGNAKLTVDDNVLFDQGDATSSNTNNSASKLLYKGIHRIELYTKTQRPPQTSGVIKLKWNASGATEIIPKINLYGEIWSSPINIIAGNIASIYSGIINFPVVGHSFSRGENISISVNITSSDATTRNISCLIIDPSNNTKSARNLSNSTSLLTGEWHSTSNYLLSSSDALGVWKIVCNATNVNGYLTSFGVFFNVASYRPFLVNIPHSNLSSWGGNHTFSVNASDTDNENVTVKLWVNNKNQWIDYGSKYGRLINWSISNFSCADIGNLSFKFEYNDSDHAILNTTAYNFTLIADNVSLSVTKRPDAIVNRSEIINISVNFYDINRQVVISGTSGKIFVSLAANQYQGNCTSDSSGNCSAIFNTSLWSVGNYSLFGGIFDLCYIQSNTTNESFSLYGKLNLDISNPSNGSILYKNSTYNFNSTIIDDIGNAVHSSGVEWNDSYKILNNSENFLWTVPLNYALGINIITFKAIATLFYYNTSPVTSSVSLYGKSKVEVLKPAENISYSGGDVEIKCKVFDLNSSGIPNYPIKFYVNGIIEQGTGLTTGADGTKSISYTPSQPADYIFRCEISDYTTAYYSAFINNASSSIKIYSNITVNAPTADKYFVDMNYGILNVNASITGIFISNVWAVFEGVNESRSLQFIPMFGGNTNNYSTYTYDGVPFTPARKGFYNITVFVNDTANNTVSAKYLNVFYSSDKTYGNISADPKNRTVSLASTINDTFSVNVTINNSGNASMYNFILSPELPTGFFSYPLNYIGNLSMNTSRILNFSITVNDLANEGLNPLNFTLNWTNPDNSSGAANKTNISVFVTLPPTLRLDKHFISGSVAEGTSNTVGNFTILSLGNLSLEGVSCGIKDGNIPSSWITYIPPTSSFFNIPSGGNQTVTLNISVPKGAYGGTYSSNITVNASFSECARPDRCFDKLTLNITVSENTTWEVPSSINVTFASGVLSNFNISVTNKGNVDMSFIALIKDLSNNSNQLTINSNDLYVSKGTSNNISLQFFSGGTGVTYANMSIKNALTKEIRNVRIQITSVDDFPPIIGNVSVSPQTVYVGSENVSITAYVYDGDKCGVDKVWANITKPDLANDVIMLNSSTSNYYSVKYLPGQIGGYKILIYANDTCGLVSVSPEISFTSAADINAILDEMNKTLANQSAVLANINNQTANNTQLLYSINQTLLNYSAVLGQMNLSLSNISSSLNQINASVSVLPEIGRNLSYIVNLTSNNTETLNKINATLANYSTVLSQMNISLNLTLFKIDEMNKTLINLANLTANNTVTLNKLDQNLSFLINKTLNNSDILVFINQTLALVNNRTANNTQVLLSINSTLSGYSTMFQDLNVSLNGLNSTLNQLNSSLFKLDNISKTVSDMANKTDENTLIVKEMNQTISTYKELLTNINVSLGQLNSSLSAIQEMNKTLATVGDLTKNNSLLISQMNRNISLILNQTLNNSVILGFINDTISLINNRTANHTIILNEIKDTLSNHSVLLDHMDLSLSNISGSLDQINSSLSILPEINNTLSYIENLTLNNTDVLSQINSTLVSYGDILSQINSSLNVSFSGINTSLNAVINISGNNTEMIGQLSQNLSLLINKTLNNSVILGFINDTLMLVNNRTANYTIILREINDTLSNYSVILKSINETSQNNSKILSNLNDTIGLINNRTANNSIILDQINKTINTSFENFQNILNNNTQMLSNISLNLSNYYTILMNINDTTNNNTELLLNISGNITSLSSTLNEVKDNLTSSYDLLIEINNTVSNLNTSVLLSLNETISEVRDAVKTLNTSTLNEINNTLGQVQNTVNLMQTNMTQIQNTVNQNNQILTQIQDSVANQTNILNQINSNTSLIPLILDYVSSMNSTIGGLEYLFALFAESWDIEPKSINYNVLNGDEGQTDLMITNTGLFDFNFSVNISGNGTPFLTVQPSIFVPRKQSRNLTVFYSVGNASPGVYEVIISISNVNSTPPEISSSIIFSVSHYVPSVKEILINSPPVYLGDTEKITVSVSDSSAADSVWIQINAQNYTLSKSDGSWSLILNTSNMTNMVVGKNVFTVFVNDSDGNIKSKIWWFEIYNQTIEFAGESALLIEFKFYLPGNETKENIITNFSNLAIEYNKTIPGISYDIVLSFLGNTIKILNASLNQSFYNPVLVKDISPGGVSIENTSGMILKVVFINASQEFKNAFSKGIITLNYSGGYLDIEKQMRVFHCKEFDPVNKKCNVKWDMMANSTVDFDKHTVSAEITGFSAYAAARAVICGDGLCDSVFGERCDTCSSDCGTCPAVPSFGGSISGGGVSISDLAPVYSGLDALKKSLQNVSKSVAESFENYTNITQALTPAMKIEPKTVDVVLMAGESKNYSVKVLNSGDSNLTAYLSVSENIKPFVEVQDEISIAPNSYGTLEVRVYADNISGGGNYYGEIKINSGLSSYIVPVQIKIVVEEPVLEPKISMETEEIQPDGNLRFNVLLSNAGFKKKFDVSLTYRIKDSLNRILKEEKEVISMEDYASFSKNMSVKDLNLNTGQYVVEVESKYLNKTVSRVATFIIPVNYGTYLLYALIVAILAAAVFAAYRLRKYYKIKELAKLKYALPVDIKKLPVGDVWLGNITEKNIKAFFDADDLATHIIVAGSTGSGKTVTAMGIIESLLEKGVPVVVFDPTAQWTGFLRPNKDEKMFRYYPKFGMKREDAKSFKGMIYEVTTSDIKLDLRKYMNPGEVSVFTLNKVPPEEYSMAVNNVVKGMFAIPWEESSTLKMVVVFDEVHRLLQRFGRAGEEDGYMSLEKACREFRKWGIGLIMVSQVLSDFKEQIKGNILTEVQLHTKSLADIGRVAEKYGADYSKSVTLMEVGTGLMQNPKYNGGKPWFVDFKPLISSPHKLAEAEISEYNKFNVLLRDIETEIQSLKARHIDVFDLELELKLARDKLKEAKFRMIEIYIDSLRSSLKKKQK